MPLLIVVLFFKWQCKIAKRTVPGESAVRLWRGEGQITSRLLEIAQWVCAGLCEPGGMHKVVSSEDAMEAAIAFKLKLEAREKIQALCSPSQSCVSLRSERFADTHNAQFVAEHQLSPLTTTGPPLPIRQNGESISLLSQLDATVQFENEALIQCRFATEQPASTAQSLLARAAATSASPSRTLARLPRPSTAGSSSARSPTLEMSSSTRRPFP